MSVMAHGGPQARPLLVHHKNTGVPALRRDSIDAAMRTKSRHESVFFITLARIFVSISEECGIAR
jgi:hypothetical protein